jgi:hypothetical protein
MTFDEQKQRIEDLEAMIDVAVGYIKSGKPGLAAIVLIGARADYLRPLATPVEPQPEEWPCYVCNGAHEHAATCSLHPCNLTKH